MKNTILLTIAFLLGTLVMAQSGTTYETGAFDAIRISHAFEVELSQADQHSVVAEVPKEILDKIDISVKNGTLDIKMKDGYKKWGWSSNKKEDILIHISFPSINTLDLSGAVEIRSMNTLQLRDLKLKTSGASEVDLDIVCDNLQIGLSGASELGMKVKAANIELNTSGASEVKIQGETGDLNIKCSGASEIQASALHAKDVKINCSGASSIDTWVDNEISVTASGMSDIRYKCGNCKEVAINTSGTSSVKKY